MARRGIWMPSLGIMSDGDTYACGSRLPGRVAAGGPVWLAVRTYMAVSGGSDWPQG